MKTRDLFFRILTVVAGVGILVMVILGSTGMKEGMGENHVDAFLLSLLSVPLLSLFVVKSEPRPLSEQAVHSGRVLEKEMELKAAEEKQELGTRLLSLINNVPGMVYRGHPDWSLSFIGAEVEQVTGYSAEEFTSGVASWKRIIHPDDREWLKEAFREAVKNQVKTLRVEYRIRHKNGDIRWVADRRQLMYDETGSFVYVDGLLLDITERKETDRSIAASEYRFRTIADTMVNGMVTADSRGNIDFFNRSAERLFGYASEEVIGKNVTMFIPERYRNAHKAGLERFLKSGKTQVVSRTVEMEAMRKDGTEFPIALSIGTWGPREAPFFSAIVLDITERKRAEEEIKALAKFPSENPDPVMRIASDGNLLYINECGTRQLSEWNLQAGKIVPPMLRDAVSRALNHGSRQVFDLEHNESVYSFTIVPISDADYVNLYGRDITERKRSEEHVARLHQNNELILCSVAEGILGLDLQGCHTFVNPAAARMLGYEVEELLGQNSHSTWHHTKPDGSPCRVEECQICAAYRNGAVHRVSTEVFWSKDGTSFPVEYVSTPIYEQGRLAGAVLTFTDITERKRAEEESRRTNELFRSAFEEAPGGMCLVSPEGRFLRVNNAFCLMLERPESELLAKSFMDVTHPEDRSASQEWVGQILAGEDARKTLEKRFLRKSGHVLWGTVGTFLLRSDDGAPLFFITHIQDITERKQAEEALRASQKIIEDIINTIPVRVFWKDRDLMYLGCNSIFARDAGFTDPKDVIGKDDYQMVWREQAELYRADDRQVLESGCAKFLVEEPQTTPEGNTITLLTSKIPLRNSNGEIGGVLGTYYDITDHKRAQEEKAKLEGQLQQAMKMEAVGTLAGGIAHDFNNALTGIVGFGELLRLRMAGDEQALHDLDEILRCAERAATLTRQLLTYARRQVIEPVNLNLSALVAELMKFIGKVAGEHIEVKISLEKNIPTIFADRGQIEQVLMNLCMNARDAMPEGGQLTVETEDVVLEEEYVRRNPYMRTGRYALLTVSDTGIGMDERTRERVFDPFFTTKGPDKGTGLGLAMVYGIVKQHNGFIHLYSEPGQGTTFKVYLPAIEAQPDAVPTIRREEIVRGGTETILLAEDEEAIRALAERILTGFGYTVLVARNGEEAVEIFRQHKEIVLAVLDVVMPRKGGKEAFEAMHKANPNLKVIFMSGYAPNAIHDSFVLIAGTPFLQKPFGPSSLARKVREVLDTR